MCKKKKKKEKDKPEGADNEGAAFLKVRESSRGIVETISFSGPLDDLALRAYRLFWNQFHTCDIL